MRAIEDLKEIVSKSQLPNGEIVNKQLDLLSRLPGQYNEQVFDKLLELAKYDPKAIVIFIENFIKTVNHLNK